MKPTIIGLVALLTMGLFGTVPCSAFAQATQGNAVGLLSRTEFNFTQDFANTSKTDMLAAKMAVEKAFSDRLRQYAQQTIDDYTLSDARLQAALGTRGLVEPARLDAKDAARLGILSKLSDVEFDREYRLFIINENKREISMLQGEMKNGKDTNLKQYAKETLVITQAHLKLAQSVVKPTTTHRVSPG